MKVNLLKKSALLFTLTISTASFVYAQTRPASLTPIVITTATVGDDAYVQNFNGITGPSGKDIYPAGWGAWIVGAIQQGGVSANNPRLPESVTTTDIATLNVSGTAATTIASVYTFSNRLGFKCGTSSDYGIYAALNTSAVSADKQVKVTFDAMVMRNLYGHEYEDGTITPATNNLVMALALQYRIGNTGDFTNVVDGEAIRNGAVQQTSGTTPANQQLVSFVLPAECSNKAVVHLRWITKWISGSVPKTVATSALVTDDVPSFAIDNFMAEVVDALPIDLKSFTGEVEGNKVRLNWVTLSETANSHFEVLYSKDGKVFDFLESVEGKGTSDHINTYSIYHQTPQAGANYYKLIQYNIDGTAEEKGLTVVNFGLQQSSSNSLTLYPNPAYDQVNMNLEGVKEGTVNLQVYDISGRKIYTRQYFLNKGNNTLTLNLKGKIPAGQYFVKVDGNGISKTGKLQVR